MANRYLLLDQLQIPEIYDVYLVYKIYENKPCGFDEFIGKKHTHILYYENEWFLTPKSKLTEDDEELSYDEIQIMYKSSILVQKIKKLNDTISIEKNKIKESQNLIHLSETSLRHLSGDTRKSFEDFELISEGIYFTDLNDEFGIVVRNGEMFLTRCEHDIEGIPLGMFNNKVVEEFKRLFSDE